MNIRDQWNEQAAGVERSFEQALAIAAEAKKCFGDYLTIDEEQQVLNTHWLNWKNNRFEIVVVGEFSTGKSTFINALLHKNVLPSKVTPTTATINFIRHIEQGDGLEKAVITFVNGEKRESPFEQLEEYVTEMSKEHNVAEEISFVEIFVDSPYLKDGVVIVDTPGLQALHPEHERITKNQIKKSNASILLFNMEQPGKRSEFKFLKDLSDSIERIFFVGNRMDGVPEDEISDVIHTLESALKENDYQTVPKELAKVFPVSSLQVLKARDKNTKTKHWNDWTNEQLLEASRFTDFENRLEDYLFNGEKTKDLIRAPYQALQHFYHQLKRKINEIEVLISGEISVAELEKEKERLTEEVELRKLQLQDKERNVKNLFQNVLADHLKSFDEQKNRTKKELVDQINEIEFLDDLEDEVSDVMTDLNKDIEQLVDGGMKDLVHQLELKMRNEIDGFEITVEDYSKDKIQALTGKEIPISTSINFTTSQAAFDLQQEQFAAQAAALDEQKALLKERQVQQQNLENWKRQQEFIKNSQEREERFLDMLLNTTDSTRKEYGVIKHRRFWFNKKGMIDVKNEDYEKIIQEKRALMKNTTKVEQTHHNERMNFDRNIALNDTEFETMEDYREAKRNLQKSIDEAKKERFLNRTKAEERQLKKELKKVTRAMEDIFDNLYREYRSLIRGLDALKLAEQSIESYIQEKDLELNSKMKDLESKKKLLEENAQKQETYKVNAEKIYDSVEKENETVTFYLLECY